MTSPSERAVQLPKVGSVKRCPNCDAPRALIKQWPRSGGIWDVTCSRCGRAWQERSRRSFVDTIRESPERLVFGVMCLSVLAGAGFVLLLVLHMFGEMMSRGAQDVTLLAILFFGAFIALVVLAKRMTPPRDIDDRRSG